MFVTYVPFDGDESLEERRHALQCWLGRDCMCEKCRGEESARIEEFVLAGRKRKQDDGTGQTRKKKRAV